MAPTHTDSEVVLNGLDFLERAVADLGQTPPDVKDATLHLFSAIEVLIKAGLIREHWTLVAVKSDGATQAKYDSGDLQTVDPMSAIKRLRDVLGIAVSVQREKDVDAVRMLRNRIAHFAMIGVAPASAAPLLGRGFDFAWWFLGTHIRPGASASDVHAIDNVMADVAVAASKISALVSERMGALEPELSVLEWALNCPRCSQSALCEGAEGPPVCKFCFWSVSGEEGADEYVEESLGISSYLTFKDGGDWPIIDCVAGGDAALVEGVEVVRSVTAGRKGNDYMACFTCGLFEQGAHIERCERCGYACGAAICESCVDYLMAD
ncbi:hypothetical protein [Nocardioides aurantiacus]|nr:hypothetical protein [Nocardioides aurantiacus]